MFLIAVKEPKKALTTCFSFGELLMTLNGLSALRDLMALTAPILLLPTFISVATISMIEVTTINKSRQFQIDERYGGTWKKWLLQKPWAMILIVISIVKSTVKTIFMFNKFLWSLPSGSIKGLSHASTTLLAIIRMRMTPSNNPFQLVPSISYSSVMFSFNWIGLLASVGPSFNNWTYFSICLLTYLSFTRRLVCFNSFNKVFSIAIVRHNLLNGPSTWKIPSEEFEKADMSIFLISSVWWCSP